MYYVKVNEHVFRIDGWRDLETHLARPRSSWPSHVSLCEAIKEIFKQAPIGVAAARIRGWTD